jgi:hypothetical protein
MTNLEMVQNILSSMDSDNVNSISDTEEAVQVETVLKEVYENIISRRRWEFLNKTRLLENVGDITKPNKMKIPTNVTRVECFRWKTIDETVEPNEEKWKELKYLNPCDFIGHVQSRDVAQLALQDRVLVVYNDDGVEMPMVTDKEPEYWTSFDDVHVYLDNFIAGSFTTATEGRTSVQVTQQQLFVKGDVAIQFLPVEMFSLFLAETKSTCWMNFKGAANQKAEQVAARQYIKMREEEPTVKSPREWYNYGKPPSGSRGYRTSRGYSLKL